MKLETYYLDMDLAGCLKIIMLQMLQNNVDLLMTYFALVSLCNVRKGRAGHTLTMSVSPLFCHES